MTITKMVERKAISELPANTVKLITATQIATSVSNIVKELVENSLDAGSTVIRVKLENSGLSKIEVIDNGSGVSKDDVLKMALPHYTSKISQHQDIETLTTYGFRGEALAAVCAVAKLSVTTKTIEDPVASTYVMDSNGDVVDVKPSHLSQGTLVVITSLFWNVPVRKQYYQTSKRKKDELTKVEDLLLNYGLIHPELHLSLHHDHSLVWQKSRAADFKRNILQTLGHSICSHMEFISEDEKIQMFLMIPKKTAPADVCFRHRPDRCFTFINQRPVTSKDIEKLMKELYSGFVQDANQKCTLYPMFIVSLQFPGDEVDVNVEPNKSQVLMKRQGDVLEFIREKVGHVLGSDPPLADKRAKNNLQEDESVDSFKAVDSEQVTELALVEETLMETQPINGSESYVQSQLETTLDPQLQPQFESTALETSNRVIVEVDDELFHGFNEPFDMSNENDKTTTETTTARIGSEEWSRGLVTNSDGRVVHPVEVFRGQPLLAKRLSDPTLPGNVAKKPKLVETEEASRIIGSPSSLLETVNGKVRKMPADPFGEYCKEMRSELISQDPLMSFTELTQNLSQGWKNLDKNSREKYENKAETNKQRYNANKLRTPKAAPMSNTSLDRFLLGSRTPVIRADKPSRSIAQPPPPHKRTVVDIDFSLDILSRSLESCQLKPQEQWFCLKKIGDNGWLCCNTQEIMAINFTRLYEMILYSRLVNEHVIPSRPVKNPILIDKKILGNNESWERLMSFTTERETVTTRIITDPRIITNGLGIRLGVDSDEAGVVVYQVPANIKIFGLNDVKNLVLQVTQDDSTVENCRPEQAVTSLKLEAARLAAERCIEPEGSEVCDLLEQWLSTDPENLCLHGKPVVWHYIINAPSGDCENDN